jgi:hypothetical protein
MRTLRTLRWFSEQFRQANFLSVLVPVRFGLYAFVLLSYVHGSVLASLADE